MFQVAKNRKMELIGKIEHGAQEILRRVEWLLSSCFVVKRTSWGNRRTSSAFRHRGDGRRRQQTRQMRDLLLIQPLDASAMFGEAQNSRGISRLLLNHQVYPYHAQVLWSRPARRRREYVVFINVAWNMHCISGKENNVLGEGRRRRCSHKTTSTIQKDVVRLEDKGHDKHGK